MKLKELKFEKITEYGDHYSLEQFAKLVDMEVLSDYQGYGYYATHREQSNIHLKPSTFGSDHPGWATHVVWYNNR